MGDVLTGEQEACAACGVGGSGVESRKGLGRVGCHEEEGTETAVVHHGDTYGDRDRQDGCGGRGNRQNIVACACVNCNNCLVRAGVGSLWRGASSLLAASVCWSLARGGCEARQPGLTG